MRVPFPIVSTPLSIRFYDGPSIAESTFYNATTLPGWQWANSGTVGLAIFPSPDGIMIWEGGEDSAYRTTIVVPEASASMLAMMAGAALLARRKRKL